MLLINAVLTILFLSETSAGSTHDKPIAEATPYPLPTGSRLIQDPGFLAFTRDQVEIIMPTTKPRRRALTRRQKASNRHLARRRVRISTSTAVSSVVASSTTPTACGRRVFAT